MVPRLHWSRCLTSQPRFSQAANLPNFEGATTASMSDSQKKIYTIDKAGKQDAEEIARVVNDAYSVEYGDSGVAVKKATHPRISNPLDDWLMEAYEKGQIVKAVDQKGEIVGMIFIKQLDEKLFFGPFAVRSDMKMQGIGTLLLQEVFKLAAELKSECIEINVVNHRTDNIPMYEKLGFVKIGEELFPDVDALTRPSMLMSYRKQLL